MSDVIYPISLIEGVSVSRMTRTLADEFEAGNVATRRYWDDQEFKRQVNIAHAHLTPAEFRYLRSFYQQRNGGYDSFWFRDNVNRGGNIKARFSGPLPEAWSGGARKVQVNLDEVAPLLALPEFDQVATAAGSSPAFWYDANRELYVAHAGAVAYDTQFWDSQAAARGATLQAGTFPLGNVLTQYQHYAFDGTAWGKSSANVSGISALKAACTLFAIVKHATSSTQQIVFSLGTQGSASGLGLQLNASNQYTPWIGSFGTWTNAVQSNGTANTWRSIAITWASGSNDGTLYTNAASVGTDSNVRSFFPGPVSLGAALDGTLLTTGNVAHVMAFATDLTLAQIKAVHNLLGYQYGLATVA